MLILKTLVTGCKFDFLMLPLLVEFVIIVQRRFPIPNSTFTGGDGVIVGVALGGGDNVPMIQVRSVVSRGIRTLINGDQEMIAHLPSFAYANPRRVLVIGGGDGGVLREVARHASVQEIVICDLDQAVIDVSKQYLSTLAAGYDDKRVHVMDGFKFMNANPGSFDVIITDSSDPVGPASVLFETPFYKAMHAALKRGGIVCTQGECMWLNLDLIRPLIRSISMLPHVAFIHKDTEQFSVAEKKLHCIGHPMLMISATRSNSSPSY